jgi:hypothetical protein
VPPGRVPTARGWLPKAAVIAAAAGVLAGGAAGGLLLARSPHPAAAHPPARTVGKHGSGGTASTAGPEPASTLPASTLPASTVPSSAPSAPATPSASPPVTGAVIKVSRSAAADPREQDVVGFLGKYFSAINSRDYRAYASLLGPQPRAELTRAAFIRGFRSTSDSGAKLRRIGTGASGDTVATVTFTSHQDPADSADRQQSCTRWRISLFLQPGGDGYLIGQAPAGYHASYSACG